SCSYDRSVPHSFPTRRSSDLSQSFSNQWRIVKDNVQVALGEVMLPLIEKITPLIAPMGDALVGAIEKLPEIGEKIQGAFGWVKRSEEHTSELQSRFDLVCRLL